jgi:hypothetical protein
LEQTPAEPSSPAAEPVEAPAPTSPTGHSADEGGEGRVSVAELLARHATTPDTTTTTREG